MPTLRRLLEPLRRTPLHPQFLLPGPAQCIDWIRHSVAAGDVVLDIGSADQWTRPYITDGARYLALDWPTTAAAYASRPNVFADAATLPFADDCLDVVLLLEVLEHLPEPDRALAEIARCLRPEGRLLLSMPLLYPLHDEPHDFQRLTRHGLQLRLARAGLVPMRIDTQGHPLRAAALLLNLALAGTLLQAIRERSWRLLPALALVPAVPVINVLAWCLSPLLATWPALTTGYLLVAVSREGAAHA